jgi:hypothetical protein
MSLQAIAVPAPGRWLERARVGTALCPAHSAACGSPSDGVSLGRGKRRDAGAFAPPRGDFPSSRFAAGVSGRGPLPLIPCTGIESSAGGTSRGRLPHGTTIATAYVRGRCMANGARDIRDERVALMPRLHEEPTALRPLRSDVRERWRGPSPASYPEGARAEGGPANPEDPPPRQRRRRSAAFLGAPWKDRA